MPKTVPKFGVKEMVQFVGVSSLDADEQEVVQRLTTEYFEKIKRKLHNVTNMLVHVKVYAKGKRKKYALHVRVDAPTHIFEADAAHDWELPRALHKAFTDMQHQIQHRFHTDVTRPEA
ncbi:hypothetical protein HY642_05385 [Candidatus Woesearchaeota archaeon]|nr:hypothetical protein [Candidatus Woesearchaeota archaeon]